MNVGNTLDATLLVVAKAPIAGFAKTRLTPPLRPVDAATLAAAALLDTLAAVRASGSRHAVVAWTGDLSRAECADDIATALADFEVIAQRGDTFGQRLAAAHADAANAGLPVLQIGTDTPQAGPDLLAAAATALLGGATVLGPATDGGWWALGLTDPHAAQVLVDVPMSTTRTGMLTHTALRRKGYHVVLLEPLTDVDHFDDIGMVAAASHGHFASTAARLCPQISAIRP
ncbi:TIGR04282 family arsenosugar biosynthesis glycosyltransferase [Nocardia sp. IBHARD005]|uniref:TIGR04282 family arsenosugar biosynthesis glycosyltransferase n=1 Tax=Nocardia sp. IBHARD005 TaxID=3457765 RepID=UPI004059872B